SSSASHPRKARPRTPWRVAVARCSPSEPRRVRQIAPGGPASLAVCGNRVPRPPRVPPVGVQNAGPSAPPFLETNTKERLTSTRLTVRQYQATVKLHKRKAIFSTISVSQSVKNFVG